MNAGAAPAFVDLLELEPRLRLHTAGLRQCLTFAFSAGGAQEGLAHALADAKPGRSLWSAREFNKLLLEAAKLKWDETPFARERTAAAVLQGRFI